MFVVTDDWLLKYRTPRGGYTREQLACIGVNWPAQRGWKEHVLNMHITDLAARRFERLSGQGQADLIGAPVVAGVEVWTDGACEPNPGQGGWGWLRSDGAEAFGGEMSTTNNRMEMTAILRALQALPDGAAATIYSDSSYCVQGLTTWCLKWAKKGWMKKGEPIANRDLWLALEAEKRRVQARFVWVRGHNGNAGNERADRLAATGRLSACGAVR